MFCEDGKRSLSIRMRGDQIQHKQQRWLHNHKWIVDQNTHTHRRYARQSRKKEPTRWRGSRKGNSVEHDHELGRHQKRTNSWRWCWGEWERLQNPFWGMIIGSFSIRSMRACINIDRKPKTKVNLCWRTTPLDLVSSKLIHFMLEKRLDSVFENDVEGMNDTRDVTEDGQENVDPYLFWFSCLWFECDGEVNDVEEVSESLQKKVQ